MDGVDIAVIAIVNYGMGNLRSVQKGFEKVGIQADIVTDPTLLTKAQGVVLPGVGAFGDAMKNLSASGMDQAVLDYIASGRPFLGICLGLQLLFEASEEWGYTEGLGVFPGMVRKLTGDLKIPHMGWNHVHYASLKSRADTNSAIFEDIPNGSAFYFVHSYYIDPTDQSIITGTTEYGNPFPVAVGKNNVYAIQFHPEKSSVLGLKLLRNFGGVVHHADLSGN